MSKGTELGAVRGAKRTRMLVRLLLVVMAGGVVGWRLSVGALPAQAALAANNDDEIVYIDNKGVVRVLDPVPSEGDDGIAWFSPSGEWRNFALADVNGDGDAEIIGIKAEGSNGRLTIFDPVAANLPDDQVEFIDEIPWTTLFDVELTGVPRLVAAGEFDLDRPGAEIIYSYRSDPDERQDRDNDYKLLILRQVAGGRDGRNWEEQTAWETDNDWTWIDVGNLDTQGIDEIVLADEMAGELAVHSVAQNFARLFRNQSEENQWRVAYFGDYVAGGNLEVIAIRTADFPLSDAWVFRYEGRNDEGEPIFADQANARHDPGPRFMVLADVGGNGDEELIMLRPVPQEYGISRARLFVLDNNNDTVQANNLLLDFDNGYTVLAAGNVDGDARDEYAIMRNNRIGVFLQPESSTTLTPFDVDTNSNNMLMGNVDAIGLARAPRLGASQTVLTATLAPGETSGPIHVSVSDVTAGTSIPFRLAIEGASQWINVTPMNGNIPTNLAITFDAAGLQPGEYRGRILVDGQTAAVLNDPLAIELTLTVESGVTTEPENVAFNYYPCNNPTEVRTQPLSIVGPDGTPYTVSITANPEWVMVTPRGGELPEVVTLTVDPARRPNNAAEAELNIVFDLPNAPGVLEQRTVALYCFNQRLLLPLMADQSP